MGDVGSALLIDLVAVDEVAESPGHAAGEDEEGGGPGEVFFDSGPIVHILLFDPEWSQRYMDSWMMPVTR